jgi:hypothetical protein
MLIRANIPFHAVDLPLFRKLLTDLFPSIDLPFSNKMSSVVLARRAAYYATEMKTKYGGNSIFVVFATKQIDAFKTRQKRKVVGVLNVMARADTGEYTKDFEGAEDLGSRKEDETAVLNIVRKSIKNGSDAGNMFPAVESCSIGNSRLVVIVTDSARCNVSARVIFSKELPGVTQIAFYAHQLNLLAGEVITHDAVKAVARTGAEIVSFFNSSTKYLSSVREIKISEYGRAKSFVSRGKTRWYSHYGPFRSLLDM